MRKAVILPLSVLLVVGVSIFSTGFLFGGPGGAASPAPPTASQLEQLRAELSEMRPTLEKLYADLGKAVRGADRDRFDVNAVIEKVGRDPQRLFEWVRDQTDALPYRGALRGPAGVLMERAGNSLDRSLLLGSLLQSVGCEVRLANAALPEGQAQSLLRRILSSPRKQPQLSDNPEVERARQRVRSLSDRLLAALGEASPDRAAEGIRLADSLADHWWVQRRRDGNWIDLDVTGFSKLTPSRTVPLSVHGDKLPLDAADCHEVELRIVIEAFKDGKLRTETVLEQTFHPAEMLGRTINFTHAVGKALPEANPDLDGAALKRFKAALAQQEVYLPVLRFDARPVTAASFTTAGEVDRNPKLDPAGKLAGGAARGTRRSLGALAGDTGSEQKPSGVLTAEWIEYEVRVPGQKPLAIRREVFDLVGPAARSAGIDKAPQFTEAQRLRRALMLGSQTQILFQPCEIPIGFALFQSARADLKEKDLWLSAARGEIDTRSKLNVMFSKLSFRDRTTLAIPVIRDGITPLGGRTFIDRPNIVHHRAWMEEGSTGELVSWRGIDLAFTGAGALGEAKDAGRDRLERGVAETLAEHLVLGTNALACANAAAAFEAAQSKGIPPIIIRPAEETAAADLKLPPDVAARVTADLRAGKIVALVSADPGRWVWWRVDPATFHTVGVADNGYHDAAAERAQLEKEVDEMVNLTGNKFTPKDLEKAHPMDMWKWANGK